MEFDHHIPGVEIGPCPPDQRLSALELLLAETPHAMRERQLNAMLVALEEEAPACRLQAAIRGAGVVGAALATTQAGRSAMLQAPRLVSGERETVADRLLAELGHWLDGQGVRVTQTLLEPLDLLDADRLARSGYEQACTLCYLVCEAENFPPLAPDGPLQFVPWRPADDGRFAPVIEATYDQTQDCPRLNGVRTTPDVLAGYRATPAGAKGPWFVAQAGEKIAGCLLLADHAATDQYELMYMGVAPAFRGAGLGRWIVAHAQEQTRVAGRKQLVLAVDAQNRPARAIYAACGFRIFTERLVYLRTAAT